MDRNTIAWTLVVFFGASIVFGLIRDATEGEGVGLALVLQLAAGLVIVAGIVVFMRRRR